ncbi:MAG: hypothetical protein O3A51_03355 [Verrucomicrobia bacterium]|nr:hypothetical protein [Verrucomicrobiota bacterium]
MKVNTLAGIICMLLAAAIWAVVLMRQPLANWLLLVIGVLLAWGGSLYFRPLAFQRLMNRVLINRTATTIRLLFVVLAAIAGVLIWVAIRSFN